MMLKKIVNVVMNSIRLLWRHREFLALTREEKVEEIKRKEAEAPELILPFDYAKEIGPGETVEVKAQPQVAVRVSRLVIDDELFTEEDGRKSSAWAVKQLFVGADAQFLAVSGMVPGSIFSAPSQGLKLRGTIAMPRVMITLVITNMTKAPRILQACVLGRRI